MNQLYRKWCTCTLLVVALSGLDTYQVMAQCNSVNTLTVPSAYTTSALVGNGNFNLIVFGNHTATDGDIEGRLAVGGNFSVSTTYSVGQAVVGQNPPAGTDNFIVNGTFTNSSGIGWGMRGNFIYVTNTAGSTLPTHFSGVNTQTTANSRLNFGPLKTYYTGLSTSLATLTPVGSSSVNAQNEIVLTGDGTARNYVFTVTLPSNTLSGVVFTNIPTAGSTVLINVLNTSVNVTGGAMGTSFTSQTLFNFPNATTLNITNFLLEGSVLAPQANATGSSGGVNGQGVIGGNLIQQGGFEFHNFCLNQVNPLTLTLTLSGSVFNDLNGLTDNTVNGTPVSSLGGNTFYANLVNATNTIVASTTLTNGDYSFSGVTGNSSYSIVLSNTAGLIGSPPPSTTLANGVINTGETIGSGPGSDGSPNGVISVSVTTTNVTNINFGVKQIPDLSPIIYALPATQYGTTNFTVVVDVYDLLPTASSGLISLYVTKDPLVKLSFDSGSVLVGGKLVQNSIWSFDNTNDSFYILTTNEVIAGKGHKSFGLTGVLTPGNTKGTLTISTTIVGGSGGEVRIDNNSDADKIDYFKK